MKNTLRRSLLPTAIAGCLLAMGGAAHADTPSIPADSTGSLTVHLYDQPAEYLPGNDGMELSEQQTQGLTPISGAQFAVQQVPGVDLTTNAGWLEAEAIVKDFDPFSPSASLGEAGGSPITQDTDQNGLAKFSDLPVGLYLVEQVGTPPVEAGAQLTPATPFLVTVPLTDPGSKDHWVYDVHVYPKNVFTQVVKTVEDDKTNAVGQSISYKISSSIPGGDVTTKYVVTDQLDPKLEFQKAGVTIGGAATSDFTVTEVSGKVTVTLGDQARADAFASLKADSTAQVVTTITAKVKQAGEIDNQANLVFSRDGEADTEVPSTTATTKFGGIQVKKVNTAGSVLSGAQFEVRVANTDDFNKAKPVTISGKDKWTTGEDGIVKIDGLRYSAFAKGEQVTEESGAFNFYWLVETKAPAGHELLTEPIPFVVGKQTDLADAVTVTNVPHNAGGFLPKTGAAGSLVLVGAGLVVAGAASLLSVRRSARGGLES